MFLILITAKKLPVLGILTQNFLVYININQGKVEGKIKDLSNERSYVVEDVNDKWKIYKWQWLDIIEYT